MRFRVMPPAFFFLLLLVSCTRAPADGEKVVLTEPEPPGPEEGADVTYAIEKDSAFRISEDGRTPLEGVEVVPVDAEGPIGFLFIMDDMTETKEPFEKSGTYFFSDGGKFLYFLPVGSTLESRGVFVSPGQKYLAVDSGTWTVRGLDLYTLPEGRKIASITYRGEFFWDGDSLYYTGKSKDFIKDSPMDDNNYNLVQSLDLTDGRIITIREHGELFDYSLDSLADGSLVLKKRSVGTAADWKDPKSYSFTEERQAIADL